MKLSNTLIGAIAIGITIGTLSSCSVVNDITNCDAPTFQKQKTDIDHCPGCGMG